MSVSLDPTMNDDEGHPVTIQGSPVEPARPPAKVCRVCGHPLNPQAFAGGCLHCLAGFAWPADDDPERSLARAFGHFETVADADGWPVELGRGAMGVTYRARDTTLRTEVALKVIAIDAVTAPDARMAFLHEARAAAALRHPNVASVFHYGEQDGQCFYVMELVEGETLEARLRRQGPLPPTQALEAARQVASALHAAEALGIVHRDLKPSNLMFAAGPAGEPASVKVIDFGLAHAADAAKTEELPKASGFSGTLSFASPEQFAGGQHPLDTRADIYALGVTLWYSLCGKLPFEDSVHAGGVRPPLPLDQLRAARVPGPVVALLKTMLKADPRERPASARQLADLITRCQVRIDPVHHRRQMAAVGLVVLAGALAVYLFSPWFRPVAPTRAVAVLPFENLSPNEAEKFYTAAVRDDVTAGLSHLRGLVVTGPGNARSYPPGNRDAGKISRELGVDHLIEGSVRREADRVEIIVRLVDPWDAAHPWKKHYAGSLADGLDLRAQITRDLAGRLCGKLAPGELVAVQEPTTTDPVAYDLYNLAMSDPTVVKNAAEFVQANNRRIERLKAAVARDPNFVLAYCQIAAAHDDLANHPLIPDTRAVDHPALAQAALEKARRLQPDNGMVHWALANHLFAMGVDPEQARLESDLARAALPNDAQVEVLAAKIARAQGRWEDAVRSLERSVALDPREETTFPLLADTYRRMRRYVDMDRTLARVLEITTSDMVPYHRLQRACGPLEERADLAPLRGVLSELDRDGEPPQSLPSIPLRVIVALFSRDEDALSRSLARCQMQPLAGSNIIFSGWVCPKAWLAGLDARRRGDGVAAQTAFTAARAELEQALVIDPRRAEALGLLAITDAGLGRREDAWNEAQRAEALVQGQAVTVVTTVRCQLAVVYAWTGQADRAFALLDELAGQPAGRTMTCQPTYGDLQLNPVWDPLRADKRFAALVARLAPATLTPAAGRR